MSPVTMTVTHDRHPLLIFQLNPRAVGRYAMDVVGRAGDEAPSDSRPIAKVP